MKIEELVEQLTEYGLDEREAYVYFHLSRLGPSKASEVVQAAEIGRTEAYRVLDELASKGAVEKTLERPQRFIARPVEEVLDIAIDEQRLQLEELSETKPSLLEAWPRPDSYEADEEVRFSVVEGRSQVRGLLDRIVGEASDEVVVVALRRGLARLEHAGLLDALEEKVEDGILTRVLTDVTPANQETVGRWSKVCDMRHAKLPGYLQMVLVDNREIALFVSVDPLMSVEGGEETVLSMNAQDFILAQKAVVDALWDQAIELEARLRELETGELADQIEVIRGRWTRYSRMKDMLYRAKDRVRLVAGEQELSRLGKAGLEDLLRRRAEAGVDITIQATSGEPPEIHGVQARAAPTHAVPEVVMVIDDSEHLSAVDASGEPGSVTHGGDWAIWSTVSRDVQRLDQQLARMWKDAN